MSCYQSHPHRFRRQHHHYFRAVRSLFKKLGMSGERNTGFVNHPFVDRACNQGSKFPLYATIAGARQGFDNIVAVFSAELTRNNRSTKRDGKKRERSGLLRCRLLAFNVGDKRLRQTEQ